MAKKKAAAAKGKAAKTPAKETPETLFKDDGKKKTDKKPGIKIEVRAKLKNVNMLAKRGDIVFKGLSLNSNDSRRASIFVREQEKLIIEIGDVVLAGKLISYEIGAKEDKPKFQDVIISGNQYKILSDIVKSECEVAIVIRPDTENMFDLLHPDSGIVDAELIE